MIVDPDFFDHWRTLMVVESLNKDKMAPLYIMRLWAHCQTRKSTRITNVPALGLKVLCRFDGDASQLEGALINAGFIHRDGPNIEVLGWADHNSKLIANWTNGATGGRPKKASANPPETQPEPTGTQAEPIRLDKKENLKTIRTAEPRFDPLTELTARGVQLEVAKDWLSIRKAKRCPLTPTAFKWLISEADKAGLSLHRAVLYAVNSGWAKFDHKWYAKAPPDDASVKDYV